MEAILSQSQCVNSVNKARPSLLQVMACSQFGAKPLPELMLTGHQLDPDEHISMNFISYSISLLTKNAFEIVVCKCHAFPSVLGVLIIPRTH